MQDNWQLLTTNNINQMLRVRNDKNIDEVTSTFKNLLIVKHAYHVADDIMFPDPACLAFFTAFEQNHLVQLEEKNELFLSAVDICEGNMRFYVYCDNHEKAVYDAISFLKSSTLFKCEFEVILNDEGKTYKNLV